jgi:hypothetical protein
MQTLLKIYAPVPVSSSCVMLMPPDLATLQAIASMIALLNAISVMMGASKRQRLVSG